MENYNNSKYNNLFLGASQYQLLNICNLIEMKGIKNNSVIFVVNVFSGADIIVKRLENEYYNVHFLCEKKSANKFYKFFSVMKTFLQLKTEIRESVKYIYISSQNGFSVLFYYLFGANGKAELRFFEDGLYTYTNDYGVKQPFYDYFKRHPFLFILFKHLRCNYNKVVYLYSPDLAIEKQDAILLKLDYFPYLGNLFLLTNVNKDLINGQHIFFDSFFVSKTKSYDKNVKCLGILINGIKNIVLKKHPRSDYGGCIDLVKGKCNVINDDCNLWESVILNWNSTNKTLISVLSSATLTPCMIFNYQYTIVLLYKYVISDNQALLESYDEFLKRIKAKRNVKIINIDSEAALEEYVKNYNRT